MMTDNLIASCPIPECLDRLRNIETSIQRIEKFMEGNGNQPAEQRIHDLETWKVRHTVESDRQAEEERATRRTIRNAAVGVVSSVLVLLIAFLAGLAWQRATRVRDLEVVANGIKEQIQEVTTNDTR
jgi:hypothetical protein